MVEVLSPCPTIWKLPPVEAQHWVRDVMEKTYPLGVFCDRTKEAEPRQLAEAGPALDKIPQLLGVDEESLPEGNLHAMGHAVEELDLRVRVAGFG
jgi:pyruvate/2-oxoacid:ferredoxin oxidoreductase beta subunit